MCPIATRPERNVLFLHQQTLPLYYIANNYTNNMLINSFVSVHH